MDAKMLTYIQSENEFSRASYRGFWEVVRGFFTQHDTHLLSFNQVVSRLQLGKTVDLGVQDVPVKKIIGSAGRCKDFTRHFLPCMNDERSKERWRNIFTIAVTGVGFPPIEVYKMGDVYFVEDGHHRVSVANYLHWHTIQANVTEIPVSSGSKAEFFHRLGWKRQVDLSN